MSNVRQVVQQGHTFVDNFVQILQMLKELTAEGVGFVGVAVTDMFEVSQTIKDNDNAISMLVQ